jgi:hypothetical protein
MTTMAGPGTDYGDLRSNKHLVPNFETIRFRQSRGETLTDLFFFLASRPCKVTGIRAVHDTAGTDAGAVTLQVKKHTGTQAPGTGTNLLTNNTNAGFDLKGAANTPQTGTLVAASNLSLAAGDRLGLDFTGVLTALAGLVVEVELEMLSVLQ